MPFSPVTPVVNADTGQLQPAGRSGHCAVATDSSMLIYGGYNPRVGPHLFLHEDDHSPSVYRQVMAQLWKFNFSTRTWSEICDNDTRGSSGIPRTAASACALMLNDNTLLVYGGTTAPWGKVMSNNICLCDIRTGKWEVLQTEGRVTDIPPKGYGQSMVLCGKFLYVFTGAVRYIGDPVAQLHRLDLHNHKWENLKPGGKEPLGRYKQEMVLHRNRLYIMGGGHEHESAKLDNMHSYITDKNQWEEVHTFSDRRYGYPKARACFGCIHREDFVYIIGGRMYCADGSEFLLNDVWRLSLITFQWQKLDIVLSSGLSFLTAVTCPAGNVYIYGGIEQDDTRSATICRHRLFVGKLAELCWEKILTLFRNVENLNEDTLAWLGVPRHFIDRLK